MNNETKDLIRRTNRVATRIAYGSVIAIMVYGMLIYLVTGENADIEHSIVKDILWLTFACLGIKVLLEIFFADVLKKNKKS